MIFKLLNVTDLWPAVLAKSHQASQLKSIVWDEQPFRIVSDNNLQFYFKWVKNLAHKPRSENLDEALYKTQDPFLHIDSHLFIGHLSPDHQLFLSKYSVLKQHLVLASIRYRQQGEPLTLADHQAINLLLKSHKGLVIYNGGAHAGCSQMHKHMQFVPIHPPYKTLIDEARSNAEPLSSGRLDIFRFKHRVTFLKGHESPSEILEIYHQMLGQLALFEGDQFTLAHNTLLTLKWLLIVPRSAASFKNIPINAFAFSGLFFPKSTEAMNQLIQWGPMNVLQTVSC